MRSGMRRLRRLLDSRHRGSCMPGRCCEAGLKVAFEKLALIINKCILIT